MTQTPTFPVLSAAPMGLSSLCVQLSEADTQAVRMLDSFRLKGIHETSLCQGMRVKVQVGDEEWKATRVTRIAFNPTMDGFTLDVTATTPGRPLGAVISGLERQEHASGPLGTGTCWWLDTLSDWTALLPPNLVCVEGGAILMPGDQLLVYDAGAHMVHLFEVTSRKRILYELVEFRHSRSDRFAYNPDGEVISYQAAQVFRIPPVSPTSGTGAHA